MASTKGYYSDQTITALTTSYQSFAFGLPAYTVIIKNDDGSNSIALSWDGVNQHGLVKSGESLTIQNANVSAISLKGTPSAAGYRLTAIGL